jgi:hypothetical protein
MKKMYILAIAALAAAATFQTAAKAEDPVSPVQGAVCNLYWLDISRSDDPKPFIELAASLPRTAAAATFADTASEFLDAKKREGINSSAGMWTGWLKQEKAGTYTFLCKRDRDGYWEGYRYSIWINGQNCVEAEYGQSSFNVDLHAGFNSVKIVIASYYPNSPRPLSITYKKAGSLKEPMSFGPGDMFYDDEE